MKKASFKVSKAIKDAGYPQTINTISSEWYLPNEQLYSSFIDATIPLREFHEMNAICVAPTYFDVWLWLWREKNINIKDSRDGAVWIWIGDNPSIYLQVSRDPEEAIITAIEYLVENDLIK